MWSIKLPVISRVSTVVNDAPKVPSVEHEHLDLVPIHDQRSWVNQQKQKSVGDLNRIEHQLQPLRPLNASIEMSSSEHQFQQVEHHVAGRPAGWCTNTMFRRERNVVVIWGGRLGNNLIQYFHSKLLADYHGWGLQQTHTHLNWQLSDFPNIRFSFVQGGKSFSSTQTCSDVQDPLVKSSAYKQNYLFFQHSRETLRCLITPSDSLIHKLPLVGPNDIMIHYRNGTAETRNHGWDSTVPPLVYFTHIIDQYFNETGMSTIHFLTDPRFRKNHHIVDGLKAKYPTRLVVSSGSPEMDLVLGVRAPILIASTETFSWVMAYATNARRIYLVYESSLRRGAKHCPLHKLFIHDDPRILYFDVTKDQIEFENAHEVLVRNTSFAQSVRNRDNPCKKDLP